MKPSRFTFLKVLLMAVSLSSSALAQVILPTTGRLAGPLNAAESQFGDEFVNFPFGTGSGYPPLRGWIEIEFGPVEDDIAEFRVFFNAVGEDEFFVFEDGHFYGPVGGFQAYASGVQVSKGELNLETREVERIEIHAVFLNSVIHQIARNNRFPLSSTRKEGFFSPLNSDYPAPPLPISLPFDERPTTFEEARFIFDGSGRITGFEFSGEGFAPVSVLPRVAFFPGYSFGEDGKFYFLAPDGCLPGTVPPDQCITKEMFPDGVPVPLDGYLHPSFDLVTTELREVEIDRPSESCIPQEVALAGSTVLPGGQIHLVGGTTLQGITDRTFVYHPETRMWTSGPRLLLRVTEAGAAAIGGDVYVVGGVAGTDGEITGQVQVLRAGAARWETAGAVPEAVSGAAVAAAGGKLYVVGGSGQSPNGRDVMDHVQIYDPAADTWAQGARMPVGTTGSAFAVVGSDLYIINGVTRAGMVTDDVWIYDTVGNAWRQGPGTQWGVYQAAAAYLDNRIYLVGGRREAEGPVDVSPLFFNQQRIQVLEIELAEWVLGIEAPFAVAGASLEVVDSQLLVLGGQTGKTSWPGVPASMVQSYDPGRGWAVCNTQPLFSADHVTNAAALGVGPQVLSPGGQAVILGRNLSRIKALAPLVRPDGALLTSDLPPALRGVSVTVDGLVAPILSIDFDRIEFQVPFEIPAFADPRLVKLQLTSDGMERQASPVEVPVARSVPGLFTYSHGETRALAYLSNSAALARNSDGRLNYSSQPASRGEMLIIRATGLGAVDPPLETGRRTPADTARNTVRLPGVWIGGMEAQVVFSRLVPAEAGVYEIGVVIPEGAPQGNLVPIEIELDGFVSNPGRVAIR